VPEVKLQSYGVIVLCGFFLGACTKGGTNDQMAATYSAPNNQAAVILNDGNTIIMPADMRAARVKAGTGADASYSASPTDNDVVVGNLPLPAPKPKPKKPR
jgi:hypothetical protein